MIDCLDCVLKSAFALEGHTLRVTFVRNPTTPARAGLSYTTECSPFRITFPGADTVNTMVMIDLLLLLCRLMLGYKYVN